MAKSSRMAAELTARRGKRGGRRKSAIIQGSARTRSAVRTEERDAGRDPGQDDRPTRRHSPHPRRSFFHRLHGVVLRSDRVPARSFNCLRKSAFHPQRENRDFHLFLRFIFRQIEQLVSAASEKNDPSRLNGINCVLYMVYDIICLTVVKSDNIYNLCTDKKIF